MKSSCGLCLSWNSGLSMPVDRSMAPASLRSFIGNRQVVDILQRALHQDRLPHALIFAGPAGVGKCTLAILLAQQLNCLAQKPDGACGRCSMCRKILAVLQSRYIHCLSPKGEVPCGGCDHCRIMADQHPDIRLVEAEKTTISIDQVRDLIREISYQPFEARVRVVILDPADQMRTEAHNSLLKTLEEPPSRTVIVLVTTNPYLLLQTIRSRSRMLQFGEIPQPQIEEHLVRERGISVAEARLAAIFSHGSLAAALSFDTGQYREARARALGFVDLLLKRGSFTQASALVSGLGKDKEVFEIWFEAVEAILQDVYFTQIAPERVSQKDLENELADLARSSSRKDVVAAIEALRKLRLALLRNVNRQIALESLFLIQTAS